MPQPRITDVNLQVDIVPEQRTLRVHGAYQLENRSAAPIGEIFLSMVRNTDLTLRFSTGARLLLADKVRGFYAYRLATPLQPGARMALEFDLVAAPKGILGLGLDTPVLANGTFFNQDELPHIGYQRRARTG